MTHYPIPAVGTTVFVTLPHPYGAVEGPAAYLVADVQDRQLVLHSDQPRTERRPPAGVPCLVGSSTAGRRSTCEAVVVASSASMLIAGAFMLIVDMARDRRRHPRYVWAYKVRLEVPGTDVGIVEGTLEDVSLGGARVRVPVRLPIDHRVFVTIVLPDAEQMLALGEVRGMHEGAAPDDVVARLQFTLMAPLHAARLRTLLDWLVQEPASAGPRYRSRRAEDTAGV